MALPVCSGSERGLLDCLLEPCEINDWASFAVACRGRRAEAPAETRRTPAWVGALPPTRLQPDSLAACLRMYRMHAAVPAAVLCELPPPPRLRYLPCRRIGAGSGSLRKARLAGGRNRHEGRLEATLGGRWSAVLTGQEGGFMAAARAVCRQLGLRGGVPRNGDFWGRGTLPAQLSALECRGGKQALADCSVAAPPAWASEHLNTTAGVACAGGSRWAAQEDGWGLCHICGSVVLIRRCDVLSHTPSPPVQARHPAFPPSASPAAPLPQRGCCR